jgi:hypothetical protein
MIDLLNLLGGWLVGLFRSPVARDASAVSIGSTFGWHNR